MPSTVALEVSETAAFASARRGESATTAGVL
jgi:hypothetical protein